MVVSALVLFSGYATTIDAEELEASLQVGTLPKTAATRIDARTQVEVEKLRLERLRLEAQVQAAQIQFEMEKRQLDRETEIQRFNLWFKVAAVVLLVVALFFVQIWTFKALCMRVDYTMSNLLKILGLILIIFSILLVLVIAQTDQQISAAIGVLGAIAGYLFGTLQANSTGRGAEER